MSKTKTVQVELATYATFDVEILPPDEDGQCEIVMITLKQQGNIEPSISTPDSTSLSEGEYQEVDKLGAVAFSND